MTHREMIAKRLREDRADALQKVRIGQAEIIADAAHRGALGNSRIQFALGEKTEAIFEEFLKSCVEFVRHVARDGDDRCEDQIAEAGDALRGEIMESLRQRGNVNALADLSNWLPEKLDKRTRRAVEDYKLDFEPGKPPMTSPTNQVNIVNSKISNAVVNIVQSGKDTSLKDIAQNIQKVLDLAEVKNLPPEKRLDISDQAEVIVAEIGKAQPDEGKIKRGLKRFGEFLTTVGLDVGAKIVAEVLVAMAR